MLPKRVVVAFACLSFVSGAQAESLPELEALRAKNKESRAAAIAKLEGQYLAALVKKFEILVKNGKKEETVPVHDEIIRMKEKKSGGEEEPKDTLRILSAAYGSNAKAHDVTPVIRSMVKDGKLNYIVDSKTLGNPDKGRTKWLRLSYQVGDGPIKAISVRTETHIILPPK